MLLDINPLLYHIASGVTPLQKIWFAGSHAPAPEMAFRVDFPRLEILLSGQLSDAGLHEDGVQMQEFDALYVPAGGWNFPQWQQPATTLSVLFGKQQLGFSVQQWDGYQLENVAKQHVARRGPRVGSLLLQTLGEIQMQPREQQTARLIATSLISHCGDLLSSQIQTASRSQALFDAIREHIDSHFAEPLTRESVAQAFYISPNYLSHLFQKSGVMGFNEYLNHTRLEHARRLLKGYDLKVKEIAHACGFIDSNYFCRLFRKKTARSPSEYRRQYHSQITTLE